MALIRNTAQPSWPADHWGFPGRAERNLRDIAHTSLLVFAVTAVMVAILAGICLSSEFGISTFSSFIVVAILFPLLCGLLAKEFWHAKKLENHVSVHEAALGLMESRIDSGDDTCAGMLIISPDLRVRFANQQYLKNFFEESEEVLGWRIKDVLAAEGVEDHARAVFQRSDPAANCCFNTLIRGGLAGNRPVHITMMRISPRHGEDRLLLVVEDLFPDYSTRVEEPVEGYVC